MRYDRVCLAGLGHELPPEVLSSAALEDALGPVYARLGLPAGRLELMSGVRERRVWPAGTPPSSVSLRSGARAIERSGVPADRIGAVLHTSVCRDFLEPATANVVAHGLGVAKDALVFDISNACLGFMNGLVTVANMIELGQIEAGLVVATENGRPLVDATVRDLVARAEQGTLDRRQIKPAFASLTIGSGSVAAVLCRPELARAPGRRLLGGVFRQATEHNGLCRSAPDQGFADEGAHPLMSTDAEAVLQNGCDLAAETWALCKRELGWEERGPDRLFCHQVGASYRRTLFERLALDPARDFATLERLGNVGSVALPLALALAEEEGRLEPGDTCAMLGIGSGLNCLMLGLHW